MKTDDQKKNHGGRRPGAGRPPLPPSQRKPPTTEPICVRVPIGYKAKLDAIRAAYGLTQGEAIRRLIDRGLQ